MEATLNRTDNNVFSKENKVMEKGYFRNGVSLFAESIQKKEKGQKKK